MMWQLAQKYGLVENSNIPAEKMRKRTPRNPRNLKNRGLRWSLSSFPSGMCIPNFSMTRFLRVFSWLAGAPDPFCGSSMACPFLAGNRSCNQHAKSVLYPRHPAEFNLYSRLPRGDVSGGGRSEEDTSEL